MSCISSLKETFNTRNSHITIRGRGVFGTTVRHIVSTENFRKTCRVAKKIRGKNNGRSKGNIMRQHYSNGDYSHLSECIKRQAIELNEFNEVLHSIKRLIEAKDTEGAINMIDSHFKNQEFKGDNGN